MSELYRLDPRRKCPRRIFFDRNELNQLLSLYSQRVISGEWRDYAIDQAEGCANFSVFRHTHDSPAFTISKRPTSKGREFVVRSGPAKLKKAKTLAEALEIFKYRLRVVS